MDGHAGRAEVFQRGVAGKSGEGTAVGPDGDGRRDRPWDRLPGRPGLGLHHRHGPAHRRRPVPPVVVEAQQRGAVRTEGAPEPTTGLALVSVFSPKGWERSAQGNALRTWQL